MFTTFDRYVLGRFLHVGGIAFVAMLGLFIVIDAFSNVDAFQEASRGDGPLGMLRCMGTYYLYQSIKFFSLIGPTLTILSAMVVLALLQKQGEIYPVLAAGVPLFRLAVPLLVGALVINGLLVLNQEVVIPSVADELQRPLGAADDVQTVEPTPDFETHLLIAGRELRLENRRILAAEFVLPAGPIAEALTTVRAQEAFFQEAAADRPRGWLLRGTTPKYDEILLTDAGRETVYPGETPDELFIQTDVTFDQLSERRFNDGLLSTRDLIQRIRNPSLGMAVVRRQTLYLHSRLTKPLINLIGVLMAVPLMFRKESRGLVTSFAACTGLMGTMFGVDQLGQYLGRIELIPPDLASWGTVMIAGTLCAWATGWART